MAKVKVSGRDVRYKCPGCGVVHVLNTNVPNERGGIWAFNGNVERPTLTPSVLVTDEHGKAVCHSFVRNGRAEFLPDCAHKHAGKTLDLPEWKETGV